MSIFSNDSKKKKNARNAVPPPPSFSAPNIEEATVPVSETSKELAYEKTLADAAAEVANAVTAKAEETKQAKLDEITPEGQHIVVPAPVPTESNEFGLPSDEAVVIPTPKKDLPVNFDSSVVSGAGIDGNITVPGNLFVGGRVNGHISAEGTVVMDGSTVCGNIKCHRLLRSHAAAIVGNITADMVELDKGCSVKGDIYVDSLLSSDGIIEGKTVKAGTVKLQENAAIKAEIVADKMAVATGAKIDGNIQMHSC